MDANSTVLYVVGGLAGIAVIIAIVRAIGFSPKQKTKTPRVWPIEIARIEERSEYTGLGVIAVIAMMAFNVFAFFTLQAAGTVLQQIAAVLGSISTSVFWGVFVIVGRKHTYRVLRDPDPPEKTEPRA